MQSLKMKIVVFVLKLFFLAISLNASSLEVENLYQVTVVVKEQSNEMRWSAALLGFKEILVRKSGNAGILQSPEVQQAYSKVTAYLQKYQYRKVKEQQKVFFELSLNFEPHLIDDLIRDSGMSIWGSSRPVTILWLAVEKNLKRKIIKDGKSKLSEVVYANALRRGVPIVLPLMDFEDNLKVSFSDVWGRFNNTVEEASQRYAADSIVIGRVNKAGNNWQAKFSYLNSGVESQFELIAGSLEALLASLTDHIAEVLCQKYCVVEAGESNQVIFQVSNIRNYKQLKAVSTYLQKLSSIRKVEVLNVNGFNIRLKLSLLGDVENIKKALKLDRKIVEELEPNKNIFKEFLDTDDNKQLIASQETEQSSSQDVVKENMDNLISEKNQIVKDNDMNMNTDKTSNSSLIKKIKQKIILYYRWVE